MKNYRIRNNLPAEINNQRIAEIRMRLLTIRHPVTIRVGSTDVRASSPLVDVREPIPVGVGMCVGNRRIRTDAQFLAVGNAIAIRIDQERIRASGEFLGIGQSVAVGVFAGL